VSCRWTTPVRRSGGSRTPHSFAPNERTVRGSTALDRCLTGDHCVKKWRNGNDSNDSFSTNEHTSQKRCARGATSQKPRIPGGGAARQLIARAAPSLERAVHYARAKSANDIPAAISSAEMTSQMVMTTATRWNHPHHATAETRQLLTRSGDQAGASQRRTACEAKNIRIVLGRASRIRSSNDPVREWWCPRPDTGYADHRGPRGAASGDPIVPLSGVEPGKLSVHRVRKAGLRAPRTCFGGTRAAQIIVLGLSEIR